MNDVINVAAYILDKVGVVSTMKLQKLVYYSHAYSLVRRGVGLFPNRIEAWANGPVVRDLFHAHKRQYVVSIDSIRHDGPILQLSESDRDVIDYVIERLGNMTGAALSDMTHSEKPWLEAREGLEPGKRSSRPISDDSIRSFYSSPECSNCVFR